MNRKLAIANKLKEARKNMNMTQQALAEKLDENQNYISLWENGKMTPPTELLTKICYHLEISVDDLLDNRSKHIKRNERLIELGKNVLDLVNEKSPNQFYEKYQLINKEQILVIPIAACQNLLDEIEEETKKNLSNVDYAKYYACSWMRFGELNSKTIKSFKESMENYITGYRKDKHLTNILEIDELTKFSSLYDIVKDFITFWIWVNQMVTYLSNDLTENGLRLTVNPISDEEFFINKDYFPKNPGTFLYRILLSRGYKDLINDKLIEPGELEDLYEYHLNDQRIETFYMTAKEKFNYINKVKFY